MEIARVYRAPTQDHNVRIMCSNCQLNLSYSSAESSAASCFKLGFITELPVGVGIAFSVSNLFPPDVV